MIITITGKPCSGKGATTAYIVGKYGFTKFSGGAIFRKIATERGIDILELNRKKDTSIDKLVDDEIKQIGKTRFNEDLIIDSRTAWMFIPKSFKVFLDVEEVEQVKRMKSSGRVDEIIDLPPEEAIKSLRERFALENERYMSLYGKNNEDLSSFDLVVDTTNLTVEEVGDKIMEKYKEYFHGKI